MRSPLFYCALGLSIATVTAAAGCSSPTDEDGLESLAESEDALSAASNSGYFIVTRRDFRRCAWPMCGGIYVKRVNEDKTRCADGSLQNECYVESIQFKGMGLSSREESEFRGAVESGKAIVKARTYKKRINGGTYGTLKASEGWMGATGAAADGTFYRAADNGIRCITTPCPTTTATPLNNVGNSYNVIGVRFENTTAAQDAIDRAAQALATSQGVIVAGGIALPKCAAQASNCGPLLMPSEFYFRVTHREGKSCGSRGQASCNNGQYCKWAVGDICGAADAPGKCAYRAEFCAEIYSPVCGCDDKTYGNACEASVAGISVSSQGECVSPCAAVLCAPGTNCEAQNGSASCVPVVPAAPQCGGIAGIRCPGAGSCADDATDSCDPQNGGADCGGRCECNALAMCVQGKHWDSSPTVCGCVAN